MIEIVPIGNAWFPEILKYCATNGKGELKLSNCIGHDACFLNWDLQ